LAGPNENQTILSALWNFYNKNGPPYSISNLFNSWLQGINKDLKQRVLSGQHLSIEKFGAIKMTLFLT
jgi:hypothetical protein